MEPLYKQWIAKIVILNNDVVWRLYSADLLVFNSGNITIIHIPYNIPSFLWVIMNYVCVVDVMTLTGRGDESKANGR